MDGGGGAISGGDDVLAIAVQWGATGSARRFASPPDAVRYHLLSAGWLLLGSGVIAVRGILATLAAGGRREGFIYHREPLHAYAIDVSAQDRDATG